MNAPLRANAKASAAQAWERRTIPLNIITGRSPSNCRPAGYDDDVAALGASYLVVGRFVNPMLVSQQPGALLRFWVHAGGRRYAALCALRDAGRLAADALIECDVFTGTEGLAREISLAENIMRRDLHPVDQCAAFEAMAGVGMSIDAIAADFAITTRQVRQRLKLNFLSPAVRAAWREGKITTEFAQAFTLAPSYDAQDAVLAETLRKYDGFGVHPDYIRRQFRGEVMRGDYGSALYVGVDAYIAEGGAIDENLFEDHPLILDAPLMKRLAREKLMRDGQAILEAEGFAFCMIEDDVEQTWNWPRIEPDLTTAEEKRLAEIETADFDGDTNEVGAYEKWTGDLEAEQEVIEARALDRALTPKLRAKAGIFVGVAGDGSLKVERGILQKPEARATSDASPQSDAPRASAPEAASKKPADPIEAVAAGRGQVRDILMATIIAALAQVVGSRPDLALVFMVARYGGAFAPDYLDRELGLALISPSKTQGLFGRIQGRGFDEAIGVCADVPLADLTASFTRIVAGSFKATNYALLTSFVPLMTAFARRGAPLRSAFVAAMDYDAYFAAATRQACLGALEAMASEIIDRQPKKPALAALAAETARKTGWLPFPLAGWAAVEAASAEAPQSEAPKAEPLAQAMEAAIDRDAAAQDAFTAWADAKIVPHAGGRAKAADLHKAYCDGRPGNAMSLERFGKAIAARGIAKHRFSNGVHYLDVRVAP